MPYSLAIELELKDGCLGAVKGVFEDVLPFLRAQDGCVAFVGHVNAESPNVLWLYESYVSQDYHRDVHSVRPEVEQLLTRLKPYLAAPWRA